MKIDTYRSKRARDQYLTVPAGTDISTLSLPAQLADLFTDREQFSSGNDINQGEPRAGMNTTEILADIAQQGFAAHWATTTVKTSGRY
ncbi:hypothetical protein HN018_26600 (plasmid) [Lichenicola cladoniae]|uniref:Uncharacterized protein n=1 Tax=Lichenicola cladoniae TaxID=1484109 RepID=A0A6M8HZZ7_9PROT|nr:hypothetical protein [Lichenicola cladoniae]NPD70376.1 hypothetical protein [Acetobacteraceae bacterium]QKE93705.1 hypothetical protein HN018_26600 [Lichenicola cladoniae]